MDGKKKMRIQEPWEPKTKMTRSSSGRASDGEKRPDFGSRVHQELDAKIAEAKKAKGYLITVSIHHHDGEGGLEHTTFTRHFLRGDIFPSLEEAAKLLEPETKIPEDDEQES